VQSVVADARSWMLANCHESVAKQINAWQKAKNPFADKAALFAEGVDEFGADVMFPMCQACLDLVVDIDRLEARLKDRFDQLWKLLKFKGTSADDGHSF
jgi:hypothetical protein